MENEIQIHIHVKCPNCDGKGRIGSLLCVVCNGTTWRERWISPKELAELLAPLGWEKFGKEQDQ